MMAPPTKLFSVRLFPLLFWIAWTSPTADIVNGIRIPECIGRSIDIREDNNPMNSITCEGFTATQGIRWTLYSDGAEQASITCGTADQTCSHPYQGITVTRPNSTHSVLVLETLHRARLGNGYISCRVEGTPHLELCNTRVIASAATATHPTSTLRTTSAVISPTSSTGPSATTSTETTGKESSTRSQLVPSVTTQSQLRTSSQASNGLVTAPPPSPPSLSGYNPNTLLSEGDRVSLTCTVTGGAPLVSSVTVLCGRQSNTCYLQPSEDDVDVDCSLVLAAVTAEDDGVICACFADWQGRPDAYSLSARVTLNVRATGHKSSNTAAYIGGGVTAAVVVIAAIVAGALLYWRYRNRTLYDRPRPRRQEDPYTDLVVYETVGQPSQTQQQDQSSSHSAAAADTTTAQYENTKTGTALQGLDV